ncbi:ANTAR domain-containing protein [Streptomyces sp. NPDC018610]|uniref:ANTAR domain-containing protein n=1 Tax=Streptomyces sp. NPDC018610 TaxID=3365049 RepID=UPI0037B2ADCB
MSSLSERRLLPPIPAPRRVTDSPETTDSPGTTELPGATDLPGARSLPGPPHLPGAVDLSRAAETDATGTGAVPPQSRNRVLAHTAVAAAQHVLLERYRLASPEEAFALLRQASQTHNVKLHTLADALAGSPPPPPGAARWFPGRARHGSPPLPGLDLDRHARTQHGAVLRAALHKALHVAGTSMGNLQLAEGGVLRLEKHSGLPRRFTDFFAFVEDSTTSCALAARRHDQVTVRDVATATVFDEASRQVILDAGSRACHSVPLLTEEGRLAGVVSTHHARPLSDLSQVQYDALDKLGRVVGRWLSWHRRTLVLDALEHLHASGIAAAGA